MYVGIYVDDLLILRKELSIINELKLQFCRRFKMTDLGAANLILGISIERDLEKGTLFLSQQAYQRKVLKLFNIEECNPTSTPIEPAVRV